MTEAQPTGVKVIKNTNTPVQVNTITLSKISLSSTKDTVCTSSGITQVIFTADKTATGSISGTIISRTDGTKIIDFNQCDVEGTTITCTAENVSPDSYSVSSLTSDAEGETININTIINTYLCQNLRYKCHTSRNRKLSNFFYSQFCISYDKCTSCL